MRRLTDEQIESLPTPRLLAYYKKYRSEALWQPPCECCYPIWTDEDYKKRDELVGYFAGIKAVLNSRGNVS